MAKVEQRSRRLEQRRGQLIDVINNIILLVGDWVYSSNGGRMGMRCGAY